MIFTKFKSVNEVDLVSDIGNINFDEFIPVKTSIPMVIAIEHFMINDNDEQWNDVRYLINSAIDKKELFHCLSEERRSLYEISNHFVPEEILIPENCKQIKDHFADIKQRFLYKWGEIPKINILIYQNYFDCSDLRKLQLKLYDLLYEKGLNVNKVDLYSLTDELKLNEHNILLSSSSFNFLNLDDISLFFGDKREIYRSDTKALIEIRTLLAKGKLETNKERRAALYKKVIQLIYQNQIIFPLAITNEYYFIKQDTIEPNSFLNNFFQPAYENLRQKW